MKEEPSQENARPGTEPPRGVDAATALEARRRFLSECQCCFCGDRIGVAVGVELIIRYEDGSAQQIWAHAACLKSRVDPSVTDYVDDQPKGPGGALGDDSPRTIDGIIAINVHEESSVCEILRELQQRFPAEGREALRQRTQAWIEEKARAGAVGFLRRTWPGGAIAELAVEEGIKRLNEAGAWLENRDDQLVAYEKTS